DAAFGRHWYFGGELEIGTLSGLAPMDAAVNRTTMPPIGDPNVSGSYAAVKFVSGVRGFAGAFSGAAELAGGLRHAAITNPYGEYSADIGNRGVIEAHGRLDWWLSPGLTVGAVAGIDMLDRSFMMFGLDVGMHFGARSTSW